MASTACHVWATTIIGALTLVFAARAPAQSRDTDDFDGHPTSSSGEDVLRTAVESALREWTPAAGLQALQRCLYAIARRSEIAARLPPREQLVAVDQAGRVIAVAAGDTAYVEGDGDLRERLLRPGEGIILIHNHPNNTGLSPADIGQLTRPGVAAVFAIAHDGSVYRASRIESASDGHRSRPASVAPGPSKPKSVLVWAVRCQAEVLRLAARVLSIDERVLTANLAHIVGMALASAGAIRYQASLAPAALGSFNRCRDDFIALTAQAALEVALRMKRE